MHGPVCFNISKRHIGRMSRQLQDVSKYTSYDGRYYSKSELETHAARVALEKSDRQHGSLLVGDQLLWY
jgi:hypothetical protein